MNEPIELINISQDKCTVCYSCLRACPVKAIVVKDNQNYPMVLHNRCIGCGSCISACSPEAISYKKNTDEVSAILGSKDKAIAICDPTISSEFDDITDYRKFVGMLRALGFEVVMEASFAVDIVSQSYKNLFENFKGKYYITSTCPAVVYYVEKFHPELVDNLAPINSPMIASAKLAKHIYGQDHKLIYIGPCIAQKLESSRVDNDSCINAVITFEELRQLFKKHKIEEENLEFSDFDPPYGYKGALYPISNGILEASDINETLATGKITTCEGSKNMINAVDAFKANTKKINQHFNIFYDEGCITGPGTKAKGDKFLRKASVIKYANKKASLTDKNKWQEDMVRFSEIDFTAKFNNDNQRLPYPSEKKIQEILKNLGKEDQNEKSDCHACGYASCRDFAVAVAKGLAKTEMCLTFALKNRQDYIKTLKTTNEKLKTAQKALEKSEKQTKKEKELASEASEITNSMLQKLRAGVVIMDKNLKIVLSNKSFINILGEEAKAIDEVVPGLVDADIKSLLPYNIYNLFSYVLKSNEDILSRDVDLDGKLINISVFIIRKSKIAGAILRDMQLPEVQKEEVIRRVTDVIDNNLSMVQQIGFLLGESASETERMLNSIIEFHKTGKK